jgi:hypothetical protein
VHGITKRDLAAMRLLALWCALGMMTRSTIAPRHYEVPVAPFAARTGSLILYPRKTCRWI